MRLTGIIGALAVTGVIAAVPTAVCAQALVDGHIWQKSSVVERRAYLVGVSNIISVGARYDGRAGVPNSFVERAQNGLKGVRLEPTMEAIDAWYRANPSQLSKPVLSVLWAQVAKQAAYSQ